MTKQYGNSSTSFHVPGILSAPKMWKEHLSGYFQLLDSWFIRYQFVNKQVKFDLLISAMSDQKQYNFTSEIGFCASASPCSASFLLV